MPANTEAPERLYVQLSPNGGTVSYKSDPREVHDNGKPVYEYIRVPAVAKGEAQDVKLRNAAIEIIYLADSIKFKKSHPPDVLASLIAKHLNGERCYLETAGGHPVILSEHLFDNTDCCVYCGKFASPTPVAEDRTEAEKIVGAFTSVQQGTWGASIVSDFTTFAARVRAEQREPDAGTALAMAHGETTEPGRQKAINISEAIRRRGE